MENKFLIQLITIRISSLKTQKEIYYGRDAMLFFSVVRAEDGKKVVSAVRTHVPGGRVWVSVI